jgi:hypothetical protein
MAQHVMSELVRRRLATASRALSVSDPNTYVGGLLERTFWLPAGDPRYADNALTPGAAPCEPRFDENAPQVLTIAVEPLAPGSSPVSRRDEATREMRRLVGPNFGRDALRWFDGRSEDWRGFGAPGSLAYGAWFGTSYDEGGLRSSTVHYELHPQQLDALNPQLGALVSAARELLPRLVPVFTSITCTRDRGEHRVSFLHDGPLRLNDLEPVMRRLGLAHRLPGLMRVVGLVLGGRFDLPARSVLLGLRAAERGVELELEVMLDMVPDVPPGFLDLLALGLAERPRELRGLARWLSAFTPESARLPGDFSALRIVTSAQDAPRVSLHLRPLEFQVRTAAQPVAAGAA